MVGRPGNEATHRSKSPRSLSFIILITHLTNFNARGCVMHEPVALPFFFGGGGGGGKVHDLFIAH